MRYSGIKMTTTNTATATTAFAMTSTATFRADFGTNLAIEGKVARRHIDTLAGRGKLHMPSMPHRSCRDTNAPGTLVSEHRLGL